MACLDASAAVQARHAQWSQFRRTHQARAQQGHIARRATQMALAPHASTTNTSAHALVGTAMLTDAAWAQIHMLLPAIQVAPNRAVYAHRPMLEGMLWVMHTGRAWRDVPAHYGPWSAIFQRYQRWRHLGLWESIRLLLHPGPDSSPFG